MKFLPVRWKNKHKADLAKKVLIRKIKSASIFNIRGTLYLEIDDSIIELLKKVHDESNET